MPIEYAVVPNALTNGEHKYAARVNLVSSAGTEAMVERMLEQGSTVTRADIYAVIENLVTAANSYLREGYRVNFGGLVDLYPSVRGNFADAMDSYDPSRHTIELAATAGVRLKTVFKAEATVEKVEATSPAPSLIEFQDLVSESVNEYITAGSVGTISGHRLDFDLSQADEGAFLILQSDSSERRVTMVQKNKPSQVVFLIPADLLPGDYWLEVRKRFKPTQPVRTGRLGVTLVSP